MIFYIVGECPICIGSGDLLALQSKADGELLFYCPSCETAWDKVPEELNEIKSLEDLSPEGVICPSSEKLRSHGMLQFEETDLYTSFDDIM